MYEFFTTLINMSITASILTLLVLLIRIIFKRAPKNVMCFLWALVAIRLILPVTIQSPVSIFNLFNNSVHDNGQPAYVEFNGKTEKPLLTDTLPVHVGINENSGGVSIETDDTNLYMPAVTYIWIIGMVLMVNYAAFSYLKVHEKVKESIEIGDKVYVCDNISTPFILGIISPKIYLPSGLDESVKTNVILHERTHLKRLDHFWKPLGFLLLTVYWFNPVLWLAYAVLCMDIEKACDERVLAGMEKTEIAGYSEALLACATRQRYITACPIAFGENDVKDRVKNILNFKKPSLWIILASVVIIVLATVGFLTNARNDAKDQTEISEELNLSEDSGAKENADANANSDKNNADANSGNPAESSDTDSKPDEFETIDSQGNPVSETETVNNPGSDATFAPPSNAFEDYVADAPNPMYFPSYNAARYMKWSEYGFKYWPLPNQNDYPVRDEYTDFAPYTQFAAPKGTEVYAVEAGTVTSGFTPETGNYVELTLDDAAHTVLTYCHLNEVFVDDSITEVEAGTIIGTVGQSGAATGPFLAIIVNTDMICSVTSENCVIAVDLDNNRTLQAEITKDKHNGSEPIELLLLENDKQIWLTILGTAHMVWDSYYIYNEDGKYYFIQYYPSYSQGENYYHFKLFYIDENGQEVVVKELEATTDEEILEFNEEVKPYLDNSSLFISTIGGAVYKGR